MDRVSLLAFTTIDGAIYSGVFAPLGPPKLTSLLFALSALVLLYGLIEILYRRRWFLHA
jgi:hypothetical protein